MNDLSRLVGKTIATAEVSGNDSNDVRLTFTDGTAVRFYARGPEWEPFVEAEFEEGGEPTQSLAEPTDLDTIRAMIARMKDNSASEPCEPDYGAPSTDPPSDDYEHDAPAVYGGTILTVPRGYYGFYSRLYFDAEGRLVNWGSYE